MFNRHFRRVSVKDPQEGPLALRDCKGLVRCVKMYVTEENRSVARLSP